MKFLLKVSCGILLLTISLTAARNPPLPPLEKGSVEAVERLIHRVLKPHQALHFELQFLNETSASCQRCVCLQDHNHKLKITGSTASELTAGLGFYLRQYANVTLGWPRGGGSYLQVPSEWPSVKEKVCFRRQTLYTYLMNVCTHSYSLVWYDWADWEGFIDWMSLSGINLVLALTGQEYVQYKVFSKLGLLDEEIRTWFNGPAFLTWSRGQNEYGNNIGGPLPKSWMIKQWQLQRNHILPRLRELGITGQLPAFQGNVPIQLKALYPKSNMTQQGDTGWMDSLDPLFGRIADLWMTTLLKDFGTQHWYQLDGYFDGSTAPWMTQSSTPRTTFQESSRTPFRASLQDDVTRDEVAYRRGAAAYMGLNRTDPEAIWSFQGWAIIGWSSEKQASFFKGLVDSAPPGKFVVIDMSPNGEGQWKQWENASFFGAPFVWTTLNNFGGSSGMKGDLQRVNRIPFEAAPDAPVWGVGATPEGIDQNPAYYEFVLEQNFRTEPVANLHGHMVERSHRRYGLKDFNNKVTRAWTLLVDSAYAEDLNTRDTTGVVHLPISSWFGEADNSMFELDRYTPKPVLCRMFEAWGLLLKAAEEDSVSNGGFQKEPFRYDLVNLGREVLAQLSTPANLNFTNATIFESILDKKKISMTGKFYIALLHDIDALVATDYAFLVGPWLESARRWGRARDDCPSQILNTSDCEHFYEWNARIQITTWNPTPKDSPSIPGGPIDYAAKHWSGLIRDYYGVRASLLLQQALVDEAAGVALNKTQLDRLFAQHAYNWTTAIDDYPTIPVGSALEVSRTMYDKYQHWFASCKITPSSTESVSSVM